MYYILQVRHKNFHERSVLRHPTRLVRDYATIKSYLNDCVIVKVLFNTNYLDNAISSYLHYIEPNWNKHWASQREDITDNMNDCYHCGIIHNTTVNGIPREYVLIDSDRNKDIMDNNFKWLLRDTKLNDILGYGKDS